MRVKACRKPRPGGEVGEAVAAPGATSAERLAGHLGTRRWKAPRAHNRVVLAHHERMGPRYRGDGALRVRLAVARQEVSAARPSGSRAAQQARTGRVSISVGTPLSGGRHGSQLMTAAPNRSLTWGRESGNGDSASTWSSSCPARASARVTGRRVKRRSGTRKREARESEHWWVLVTSRSVAEIVEGHLAQERRARRGHTRSVR